MLNFIPANMQVLSASDVAAVFGAGGWVPGCGLLPPGGAPSTGVTDDAIPGTGMAPQGGWIPGG